jgi:hypothetical protein
MTREELIEIAEQVYGKCDWHGDALNHLEQLAKLVAEKEREECAECGADGGHALYCVACAEKFVAQTETKDEPVAIVISESGANVTHSWWHEPALAIGTKLYTSPQRTWVELTDEEIEELRLKTFDAIATNYEVYRAIEAKLKEKNT